MTMTFSGSFACICATRLGKAIDPDFEKAELIFIGKVIKSTDSTYKFQIIEHFKGTIGNPVEGSSFLACSTIRSLPKGEVWLVYGSYINQKIEISNCSRSRPLVCVHDSHPELIAEIYRFNYERFGSFRDEIEFLRKKREDYQYKLTTQDPVWRQKITINIVFGAFLVWTTLTIVSGFIFRKFNES